MARRKQKFSVLHLLIMAAILIWLPAMIERMAGIPSATMDPEVSNHQSTEKESVTTVNPASSSQVQTTDERPAPTLKPAPSSLRLQETLLSASGKTAIINGRAFGEQEMITPLGYPYRIQTILAGRVILEGDGSLYELKRQAFP
ncbi:MAG: hypothetical protein HUJ26_21535 [Planctomycetaceae bacterium]|nr:hypothetical protein [Planctomycetaceae bacterium]